MGNLGRRSFQLAPTGILVIFPVSVWVFDLIHHSESPFGAILLTQIDMIQRKTLKRTSEGNLTF